MKTTTRTIKILRALAGAAPFILAGCMAQPLPAGEGGAVPQNLVGPWRVSITERADVFSDFVFDAAGKVTHLRSVVAGETVDPMQGAGVVHATSAGAACAFGSEWSSFDGDTLMLSASCTDGVGRELELAFVGTQAKDVSTVTVAAVDGATDWMAPVAWTFSSCAARPCQ